MARITVEKCLEHVPSRFDLILLASGRARQLSTTSREPMVEANKDKNTLIALREIEEGLIDAETLEKTLEEVSRVFVTWANYDSSSATEETTMFFECHPETSFCELAKQPLSPKKTKIGSEERRDILRSVVPDLDKVLEILPIQ